MSKKCSICGSFHKDGAQFCSRTGKPILQIHGGQAEPTIVIKEESFTQPISSPLPAKVPEKRPLPPKSSSRTRSGRGKCPLCGGFHSRDAKFCSHTGKEIFRRVCPICGEELLLRKADAAFCPLCGGLIRNLCPYKDCCTPLPGGAPFCTACLRKIHYCLFCKKANPLGHDNCIHCSTPLPEVPGQWLSFKGNNACAGFTKEKLDFPLSMKWSFPDREKANRITASPLVWNGTIYICDYGTVEQKKGTLYALNQYSGDLKWSRSVDGAVLSTPVIAGGMLYMASLEGRISALDAQTGKPLWVYPRKKSDRTPAVDASLMVHRGMLFVSTRTGVMMALECASGDLLWTFSAEKPSGDESLAGISPCICDDMLIFALPMGIVYGLSADSGNREWRFPKEGTLDARISGTPAASESLIFVGDRSGRIYSLKKETGEDMWHGFTQIEGSINSSLSLGPDALFAGTWAEYFYAIDKNAGGERWRFRNERITVWDSTTSPPLVLDEGTVLYGSNSGYVYALNRNGHEEWSYRLDKEIVASPVASDGFLYIACTDGILYAFHHRQQQKG